MNKRISLLLAVMVLFTLTMTVAAQTSTSTPAAQPNANISWPPPVYVLRGQVTVHGSANLSNMTGYFIEFQALNDDLSAPTPELWLPATLPSTSAVQDGELGVWNTNNVPDGIYELRLTINVSNGQPVHYSVTPLRIQNTPSPFEATATPLVPTGIPTQILPTLAFTPTAIDSQPRATALRNANVRKGDGTNYEVVGGLDQGDSAAIIGLSALGTGWYQIQLPDGRIGWVAPSVVDVSGNLALVPRVSPPLPPTATPVPVTSTPVSQVNLVAGNFRFDPGSPKCAQTFNIYIDVANFGSVTSPSGVIGVSDFRRADGSFQQGTVGAFPPIAPGQTVNVGPIPLTISTWYNEEHRLLMSIDPNNLIGETNEGDNSKEAIYTLEKAGCP